MAPPLGRSASVSEEFKTAWAAFRDAHRNATLDDLEAEGEALAARFREDEAAGLLAEATGRNRKRTRRASAIQKRRDDRPRVVL